MTILALVIAWGWSEGRGTTQLLAWSTSARDDEPADSPEPSAVDMVDGYSVHYQLRDGAFRLITLRSGQTEEVISDNDPSLPVVPSDKKRFAYIDPFDWEVLGEVYLFSLETGLREVIVSAKDLEPESTPKVVAWLSERYLLVIIGYAWGTITAGGDVYVFDTATRRLSPLISRPRPEIEITDVQIDGSSLILSLFNLSTEASAGKAEFGYDLVLAAAATGGTVSFPTTSSQ